MRHCFYRAIRSIRGSFVSLLRAPRQYRARYAASSELVTAIQLSQEETLRLIGLHCLTTQVNLAHKVASQINMRVYLYDPHCFFNTPPFDIVLYDNIRTVRKGGKTALLSTAAQEVVTDSITYRSLIPPFKISEDSFGVYINP